MCRSVTVVSLILDQDIRKGGRGRRVQVTRRWGSEGLGRLYYTTRGKGQGVEIISFRY